MTTLTQGTGPRNTHCQIDDGSRCTDYAAKHNWRAFHCGNCNGVWAEPENTLQPMKRGRPSVKKAAIKVKVDISRKGCILVKCPHSRSTKGLCALHYQQWRRGTIDIGVKYGKTRIYKPGKKCVLCGEPHKAKDLCKDHYKKYWRKLDYPKLPKWWLEVLLIKYVQAFVRNT